MHTIFDEGAAAGVGVYEEGICEFVEYFVQLENHRELIASDSAPFVSCLSEYLNGGLSLTKIESYLSGSTQHRREVGG